MMQHVFYQNLFLYTSFFIEFVHKIKKKYKDMQTFITDLTQSFLIG